MAGEWQTLTVDEIKAPSDRSIAIGPFGSRMKADTYVAGGVPVIRGTNISDTRALVGDFVFVSDQTADELRACNVHAGDLVFPHRGAIGQVALVPNDSVERYMMSTSLMKLSCDTERVDPQFIFYFFRSSLGRHALLQHASTVGTPGIGQPLASLRSIRVPVPPLPEQRAIAHILGTLDDKIELNRRMNETLEAMARALFKSWFVDFDPVRAKAEGRDPVLPKPLADLFPSSFEKFELGEIPQGWRIGTLGMLGELAIGGDWGEDEEFPDAVQASCLRGVDLEHLRLSGHASAPRRWFKPSSLERREMNDRDVLVAGSGAGPTGRPLWMCTDLLQTLGPCVYSNFCKRIRCGTSAKAAYLDSWLYIMRESGEIWEYVNGTSVPNLDASSLLNGKKVPLPPDPVVEAYHDFLRPIRKMLYMGQNDTLAVLRDTLLPEIVSGRLRCPPLTT